METASNDDQGSPDLVFGDVGGWISGPSLDLERLGAPRESGSSQDAGRPGGSWPAAGRSPAGPSPDAARPGGARFGLNVGAWMQEYGSRYVLQGGPGGFGFVCWRRSGTGRPSGEPMMAATLDDLAVLVDLREARADKPADG